MFKDAYKIIKKDTKEYNYILNKEDLFYMKE